MTARPALTPASRALWIAHREKAGASGEWADVFLVVNTGSAPYSGELSLPSPGCPFRCDVKTGRIDPVPDYRRAANGALTLRLELEGYGVQVLACRSGAADPSV